MDLHWNSGFEEEIMTAFFIKIERNTTLMVINSQRFLNILWSKQAIHGHGRVNPHFSPAISCGGGKFIDRARYTPYPDTGRER